MWNSWHFFNYDFDTMNHCLTQVANRLPESMLEKMFFIRYWHGGPHLRFRLHDSVNSGALVDALQQYWQENGCEKELDRHSYYAPYRKYFSGEEGDVLYPAGSIQALDYIPETSRYGGADALPFCEAYFCQDSKRILKGLSQKPSENETMLYFTSLTYATVAAQLGLDGLSLLNINGISATSETRLVSEKVTAIFTANNHKYQQHYQTYIGGGVFAETGQQISAELGDLIAKLQELQTPDIEVILHSLLHMSFNRAGVAPFKESTIRYFAYLSHRSFGNAAFGGDHAAQAS